MTLFGYFPIKHVKATHLHETPDDPIDVELECGHFCYFPTTEIKQVNELHELGCLLCYLKEQGPIPESLIKFAAAEANAYHAIESFKAVGESLKQFGETIRETLTPAILKLLEWYNEHEEEVKEWEKEHAKKSTGGLQIAVVCLDCDHIFRIDSLASICTCSECHSTFQVEELYEDDEGTLCAVLRRFRG